MKYRNVPFVIATRIHVLMLCNASTLTFDTVLRTALISEISSMLTTLPSVTKAVPSVDHTDYDNNNCRKHRYVRVVRV